MTGIGDTAAEIRAALVSGHCGVREMDAALRAVLDLHVTRDAVACVPCARGWSCPTLVTIAKALGVSS